MTMSAVTILGYSGITAFLTSLVAIVISIVLHELAHGYVALWNGDLTAKVNGRLSINPLKHFDPIGFVMLLLVRFGYAKPVPVNPDNFRRRKLGMFTVSVAGVALNLLLAFFSTPFYLLCLKLPTRGANILGTFFMWMVIINVNLALFNLIPIFPLDGYRVIESFTRGVNPFNKFMRNYGYLILIVLVLLSAFTDIFNLPAWCDPVGYYLNFVGSYVRRGFGWLWGLVIR